MYYCYKLINNVHFFYNYIFNIFIFLCVRAYFKYCND